MENVNLTYQVKEERPVFKPQLDQMDLDIDFRQEIPTMSKLSKNENVSMDVIEKICTVLKCDIGDIMEFVPDEKEEQ